MHQPVVLTEAGRAWSAPKETIMLTENLTSSRRQRNPWNKGRLIGQKRPLKSEDVWRIRVRLQLEGRKRDLALFNLAIDSKLRGCDLVCLQIADICIGGPSARPCDGGPKEDGQAGPV
jgi:hypothetical protein